MQSTAIPTRVSNMQSTKQSSSRQTQDSNAAELTDPFLQIIMSILAQSQELSTQQDGLTSGTADSAQISGLAALLQNSAAGLTFLQGDLLSGASSELGASTEIQLTPASFNQALLNVLFGSESGNTALETVDVGQFGATGSFSLANIISSAENENTNISISSDALTQMSELLGLSGKDELQSLLKGSGLQIAADTPVLTEDKLSQSVVGIKESLLNQLAQQSSDQDEIDVDKLQNELVKADASTPFELQFKNVSKAAEPDVLSQLTDGIKQNISLGKSEFVVKLKPEALGEITVKLVEEAGKTTLSITTASAHTAKLINSDLDALREAVAPMNVEVHNAVTSANETAGSSMQQFNMSGQQFAGQQFSGQQSFYQMTQNASGSFDSSVSDEAYETASAAQVRIVSGDRLDAYI